MNICQEADDADDIIIVTAMTEEELKAMADYDDADEVDRRQSEYDD